MPSALKKLRDVFRSRNRMTPEEYAAKLLSKGLNPDGSPILDPTPLAPPIGYKRHPSMVEMIRDMVRSEKLAEAARASGAETFEESEDFDVGDEPELMRSPWENEFDPPLEQLLEAGRQALKEKSGVQGALPPAEGREAAPKPPKAAPTAPEEP